MPLIYKTLTSLVTITGILMDNQFYNIRLIDTRKYFCTYQAKFYQVILLIATKIMNRNKILTVRLIKLLSFNQK